MCRDPLARFRYITSRLSIVVVLVVAAGVGAQAPDRVALAQTPDPAPGCPRAVEFVPGDFPSRAAVDNRWLPLIPGTQLTLEGRANRGGGPLPHTVTFTVTDLTKVIDGVRTRVVWDVDVNEGELAETELAFFAQDLAGNVWNLGEYPEEFDGGAFLGAPNTWIAGMDEAEAGLHMLDIPFTGDTWLQGFAPAIDFLDCAEVVSRRESVCVPAGCFDRVLLTHETSPLDPDGGVQLKYHARGVGIVQVGALNDPEGETLVLRGVRQLDAEALAAARNQALILDSRGYFFSPVYAQTAEMELPPGVSRPVLPAPGGPPAGSGASRGGTVGAGAGTSQPGATGSSGRGRQEIDPDRYTSVVDNPLWPLATVGRTRFRGHEEDTSTRVVSRVLDRTRKVAGVRVAIVDVREFEDGELVEHTRDYYAQDRKGRVWYFGESVDDIENGKVVGHDGQWFAGRNGAKPGLFMPAKPRLGQVFRQERAPGVAEDRSKVVALDREVETPAGSFDRCIKTRDFAPLDNATEFKFYCPGVGLVREQARQTRLSLVSYSP
jgi:hypothetical protein